LGALAGLDPELVVGDILDQPSLRTAMRGCDLIFHVAAISDYWRVATERVYHVNVRGTQNVVDAAAATGIERLVYTSSVGALGMPKEGEMLDESARYNLQPQRFVYGHSKHLGEEVVQRAVRQGLDAVIVNPAAVVGARDVNFIGGSLLRESKRGLTWVTFSGSLNWVDAEAVGLGHVLAAELGETGSRYILAGENVPHRRAMEIVAGVVGGRRPVAALPGWMMGAAAWLVDGFNRVWPSTPLISGEQTRLSAMEVRVDGAKAIGELGFPYVDFRTCVDNAFAWYRDHGGLR
jgi:dihydroflavonol-4-reductase